MGFTTDEDTGFTSASVLTNDSDSDGGTLSVQSIDTTGTLGLVTDNGDGTFTYDPNGQFEALGAGEQDTDSFTYTLSDGQGGTDTATVTITINGVDEANIPPTAVDDGGVGFTTDEDTGFTSASVLTNDSDSDGGTLSVSSRSIPAAPWAWSPTTATAPSPTTRTASSRLWAPASRTPTASPTPSPTARAAPIPPR